MAKKSNIRSIRFSDEIAELIDRQIGDTFTQKFENLIIRCTWELPGVEHRLEELNKEIKQRQEKLQDLKGILDNLRTLEHQIKIAEGYVEEIAKSAKSLSTETTKT